jgi:hypothetical protein
VGSGWRGWGAGGRRNWRCGGRRGAGAAAAAIEGERNEGGFEGEQKELSEGVLCVIFTFTFLFSFTHTRKVLIDDSLESRRLFIYPTRPALWRGCVFNLVPKLCVQLNNLHDFGLVRVQIYCACVSQTQTYSFSFIYESTTTNPPMIIFRWRAHVPSTPPCSRVKRRAEV